MRRVWLRLWAAALALCFAVTSVAQPLNVPIPSDDSDLQHLVALAAKLKAQGGECKQCRANGGHMYCDSAVTTANAADDLRLTLYGMIDPLQQAAADTANHLFQFNKEHQVLNDHNRNQKLGLAISQVSLNSGKIALDLISLTDSVKGLKELLESGAPTAVPGVKNLSVVPDDATFAKILTQADTVVEAINGSIGAADDAKSSLHESTGGFVSKTASTWMTIKGAASDAAGSIRGIRSAMAAARAGKAAKDISAGASPLMLFAKAFVPIAEQQIENLANEIAHNEYLLQSEDEAMQGIVAQLDRIHQRQAALQKALDAVRDAAAAGDACAASCSNSLGPKPVPGPSGLSYGAALKSAHARMSTVSSKLVLYAAADLCKTPPEKPAGSAAPKTDCAPGKSITGVIENEACQLGK